jgi:hypothetical protein
MMTRLTGTRPVRFRVHVDHVDNPKGDVYAISFGKRYITAQQFAFVQVPIVEGKPVRKKQPRIFLEGYGTIWRSDDKATVIIT